MTTPGRSSSWGAAELGLAGPRLTPADLRSPPPSPHLSPLTSSLSLLYRRARLRFPWRSRTERRRPRVLSVCPAFSSRLPAHGSGGTFLRFGHPRLDLATLRPSAASPTPLLRPLRLIGPGLQPAGSSAPCLPVGPHSGSLASTHSRPKARCLLHVRPLPRSTSRRNSSLVLVITGPQGRINRAVRGPFEQNYNPCW